MKEINLTSSKELYKTAAEIEKNGGKITKIYNQPNKKIFKIFFEKLKKNASK